jgi:undecaprenyl-diphosphatase
VTYDDSGIWSRRVQNDLLATLLVGEVGAALWEGGETRLGHTLWQSVDTSAIAGVLSEALKYSFSRARPSQTDNPNLWFQGGGDQSFPSGEVTAVSAVVTPLVLEYAGDHPSVMLLEALPVYDAIARVKVHGHWQSDVIAGFALGTGTGYLVHRRSDTPWILSVMPHGIYVGLKTH